LFFFPFNVSRCPIFPPIPQKVRRKKSDFFFVLV